MPLEIERKFLIDVPAWEKFRDKNCSEASLIKQWYLKSPSDYSLRLRSIVGPYKMDPVFILGFKIFINDTTRHEIESEIPKEDVPLLLSLCTGIVVKKRYKLFSIGKCWEIDEYQNNLKGLFVTEIELESEGEEIKLPEWVGEEVTGNKKFSNHYLATKYNETGEFKYENLI